MRAVLYLARHHGRRRKAREVADEMDIPARYLTQILAKLVQQGFLTAVAGPSGGYCLAHPPEDISLLDIVEAAEGPIGLEQCVLQGGPCDWEDSCPIHVPWARAQNAMAHQLSITTFADLANASDQIDAGTHELPTDTPPHKLPTSRRARGGKRQRK